MSRAGLRLFRSAEGLAIWFVFEHFPKLLCATLP